MVYVINNGDRRHQCHDDADGDGDLGQGGKVHKMMPIFTLARTPGAVDAVEWESICHSKQPFVLVHHTPTFERSRWVHEPRKRPFTVSYHSPKGFGWSDISHHATLAAAEKAARKAAAEEFP